MTTLNATAAFLGGPDDQMRARIVLDDVHGLWGGRQVWVQANGPAGGRALVRRVPVPGHEQRSVVPVSADEVQGLLEAVLASDFLSIRFEPRPIVPDETHAVITLTNRRGECASVAKWARDRHPGFEAVYAALLALEARPGRLVFEGPFDPDYAPGEAELPSKT
jgi:hypothetical protein